MGVEILNQGASIKVVTNGVARYVTKFQIKEIAIIKDEYVKLDIGQGLYNIFIHHPEVTTPATANVEELREAINTMLETAHAGAATEAKQNAEIEELFSIRAELEIVKNRLNSLNDKIFFEPLLKDESNPRVMYKGFALPGSSPANPIWAIQKVSVNGGVTITQWAKGSKNLENIWDKRDTLQYS